MALEALLNFLNYDNISANPYNCNDTSDTNFFPETCLNPQECRRGGRGFDSSSSMMHRPPGDTKRRHNSEMHGQKKRRRRPKVRKNKEEAETQRMTHIAVERNRRKQMNNHLTVLRSLMPEHYVQRGDQASIVGGAIEYVKELEYLLQSLEAQKLQLLRQGRRPPTDAAAPAATEFATAPFAQFFAYPQYTLSQFPNNHTSKSQAEVADIEVTLIETHANLRILSQKSIRQLSKMVAGFQIMCLAILHLNVTSLDSWVLYSISTKVEEGCQLNSADEIAGAVHHMLRVIEEDATLC